jgi:hypothetical protein
MKAMEKVHNLRLTTRERRIIICGIEKGHVFNRKIRLCPYNVGKMHKYNALLKKRNASFFVAKQLKRSY